MDFLYSKIDKDFNIKLKNNIIIDKNHFNIIAGPCAIESKEHFEREVIALKGMGVNIIRAGFFKPRTSPYSFQGLKEDAFNFLIEIKEKYHILLTSEITDLKYLDFYLKYIDIIQVGARNMQNFVLLEALGKVDKPILLKRGFANTIDEWLQASEYILKGGNKKIILCERGIRTFETKTRNTLDLSSVSYIKNNTNLPIFVDPSHACGLSELVSDLSLAALAAGADGLIIEVHENPEEALSDGRESIDHNTFNKLISNLEKIAAILNKKLN